MKISQEIHQKWSERFAWILLGRILGKAEKLQVGRAEECIQQGIKILDELKLKPFSSQGYLFLGEVYADTGQQDKALKNLKEAEGAFQEMGMDYWLARTQEVLGKL